jgi:hypothetical protein
VGTSLAIRELMPQVASGAAHRPCVALCGDSSALLVLFTNAWSIHDTRTLAALRAELTSLRIALLVVGDDALFYFNPRPAETASALAGALESRAISVLREAYDAPRRTPGSVILSLVEPNARERFRFCRQLRGDPSKALLEAVQLARQSVDLRASFGTSSEKELLLYSLVGAINLVLTESATPARAAQGFQA